MGNVSYRVEAVPEECAVRGNVSVSGDDLADREAENEVLARLEQGDYWAWATVRVVAELEGFEGDAYLGCCSYKDEADFMVGGYFEQMKDEARERLARELRAAVERGTRARELLKNLS